MSLGLSGPCEVLSQQGTAVADIQDLGLLLPDQPWSWRAWPSRDPGQSLGPGLGTHGGQWGPLLMYPGPCLTQTMEMASGLVWHVSPQSPCLNPEPGAGSESLGKHA